MYYVHLNDTAEKGVSRRIKQRTNPSISGCKYHYQRSRYNSSYFTPSWTRTKPSPAGRPACPRAQPRVRTVYPRARRCSRHKADNFISLIEPDVRCTQPVARSRVIIRSRHNANTQRDLRSTKHDLICRYLARREKAPTAYAFAVSRQGRGRHCPGRRTGLQGRGWV